MTSLRIRDNRFDTHCLRFGKLEDDAGQGEVAYASDCEVTEGLADQRVTHKQRKLLEKYGKMNLADLEEESGGTVVDLSETHLDNVDRRKLYFFEYREWTGDDAGGTGVPPVQGGQNVHIPNGFSLHTGNIMGVLRFRDGDTAIQVEVLSRFDTGRKNFFLNYLLSKALNVAFSDEAVSAEQPSVLNLLLDVLFVRKLGEAAENGLLRQYRTFRNNDWNFKGRFDLPRHVRENIPMSRGIAYVKREIDLDVPVNRLVLLAALAVRKRRPDLFHGNENAEDAFRELRTAIPDSGDTRSILSNRDSREPVRHPFYREIWEPLRQLARMILEEERWQLFQDDKEEAVSGVIFDGAWLWEEYLASVLVTAGFRHCAGTDGTVQRVLPVFEGDRPRFAPDFLRDDCVLDAKYKRSNPNGGRDDVHQILCYLLLTGAKLGGLVFPPVDEKVESSGDRDETVFGTGKTGWSMERTIASPYGKVEPIHWSCFSWERIPDNTADRKSFGEYMKDQEEKLKENLLSIPTRGSCVIERRKLVLADSQQNGCQP